MPPKQIEKKENKKEKKETGKDKIVCIKDKEFTFTVCLKETNLKK